MNMNQSNEVKKEERYTYEDYLTWDETVRYELIDGVPYMMSPAPLRRHQEISGEIFRQLANFLRDKPCRVYSAPFDVRLNEGKRGKNNDTVVQPDIVVVCDSNRLDERGCKGAPDMVVEILSPSNSKHDTFLKFKKYLEAGVREYWIADPERMTVSAHILTDGKYVTEMYGENEDGVFDTVPVHVLSGCGIDLKDVFAEKQ